jgi:hypothetical protein
MKLNLDATFVMGASNAPMSVCGVLKLKCMVNTRTYRMVSDRQYHQRTGSTGCPSHGENRHHNVVTISGDYKDG